MAKVQIHCRINGEARTFETYPMARLIDVLREDAALTGTKEGCGEGECGACSIIMDGLLVNSCLIPALQADGCEITTVEGIADQHKLAAIQKAFWETNGTQCGICSPGMILAALHLLQKHPKPSTQEIRTGLAGNLCRCGGYVKNFDAVLLACRKVLEAAT